VRIDSGLRGRAATGLALLVFAGAGAWLFSDAIFSGKYLAASNSPYFQSPFAAHRPASVTRQRRDLNDLTYILHPYLFHARGAIRGGRLPLWDPHVAAGRPLGSAQGAPFYPLNSVAYVIPFWRSLGLILILKVLAAATGTFLLLRRLLLSVAASTFGGLAFALGTPFVPFLGHGETSAFALLPWCLFLIDRLIGERRVADGLLLGLAGAIALYAGHPESSLLVGVGAGAFTAFRLFEARREDRTVQRPLGLLGIAVVLAGSIGSLALFPLAEVVANSFHLSRAGGGSLKQLGTGLFFPELWGRPDKHLFPQDNPASLSASFNARPYLGALAPVLALAGMASRRHAAQLFFAGLGGLSLLAVLDTPVQAALKHVPLISLAAPYHFIWLVMFSLAILAAFGFDRLLEELAMRRRRVAAVAVVVAVVPAVAWLGTTPHLLSSLGDGLAQLPTLRAGTTSADAAAAGAVLRFLLLCGAAAAAYLLFRARSWGSAGLGVVLVALTLVDLVTMGRGYFAFASAPFEHPPVTPTLSTIARGGPAARALGAGGAFSPNLADEYGVQDARVQALPELERYTRLFTSLGGTAISTLGWTIVSEPPPQKLLDLFAVRYVIGSGRSRASHELHMVYNRPGEQLLENSEAFPRAWVAYGWRAEHSPGSALRTVAAVRPADLQRAPTIEGISTSRSPAYVPGAVTIRDVSDTRVELRVAARAAGYLVLDDTYYPGWTATMDGRPATIRPANVAFRALAVAPGRHVVRFSYAPGWLGFAKGLVLAGLAVVGAGLGALAVVKRRRRRRVHVMAPRP
jgi:hypothetical protein